MNAINIPANVYYLSNSKDWREKYFQQIFCTKNCENLKMYENALKERHVVLVIETRHYYDISMRETYKVAFKINKQKSYI